MFQRTQESLLYKAKAVFFIHSIFNEIFSAQSFFDIFFNFVIVFY